MLLTSAVKRDAAFSTCASRVCRAFSRSGVSHRLGYGGFPEVVFGACSGPGGCATVLSVPIRDENTVISGLVQAASDREQYMQRGEQHNVLSHCSETRGWRNVGAWSDGVGQRKYGADTVLHGATRTYTGLHRLTSPHYPAGARYGGREKRVITGRGNFLEESCRECARDHNVGKTGCYPPAGGGDQDGGLRLDENRARA